MNKTIPIIAVVLLVGVLLFGCTNTTNGGTNTIADNNGATIQPPAPNPNAASTQTTLDGITPDDLGFNQGTDQSLDEGIVPDEPAQ